MSTLDKYHKSLYPSNAVSMSTNFCNVYFVFFADFELCCVNRISIEASTITGAATICIIATTPAPILLSTSKSCSWWRRTIIFMSSMGPYMIPVFRILDCIFANSTVCVTTFMITYENLNELLSYTCRIYSRGSFSSNYHYWY